MGYKRWMIRETTIRYFTCQDTKIGQLNIPSNLVQQTEDAHTALHNPIPQVFPKRLLISAPLCDIHNLPDTLHGHVFAVFVKLSALVRSGAVSYVSAKAQ